MLQVMGIALWAALGVIGAWLLVTGRPLLGLPNWVKKGWPLRTFGLVYFLGAAFLIYETAVNRSFAPDGVIVSYVFIAIALVVAMIRRRKQPIRRTG